MHELRSLGRLTGRTFGWKFAALFGVVAVPADFPNVCPLPDDAISIFGLESFPLSGGDIVVQDAPH